MAHSDSEVRALSKLKPNNINEIKENLIQIKKNERSGKDNPTKKNIIDPNDGQREIKGTQKMALLTTTNQTWIQR